MLAGTAEIAKALLTAGADPNKRNSYGYTALMRSHRADVARVLLQGGADLSAKSNKGKTALELAVADNEYEKALVLKAAESNRALFKRE